MARSPLVDAVRLSLRAARASAVTGIPAEEWLLSRREVLRVAAGAAGTALLGGCALDRPARVEPPAPRSGGPRVVIVGGGIAGLHCARRLRGMGVVAEVREASGRIGGRVLTDHHTFGALSGELGGEFVNAGHGTMLDLAEELGLELLDFGTDDAALAKFTAYAGGSHFSWIDWIEGIAPAMAHRSRAMASGDLGALDRMSTREWLDGSGCTGDARRILEVVGTMESGLDTDESSALGFVGMLSVNMLDLGEARSADRCFRFRAGNEIVAERMARDLEPGQVRLASRLVRVRRDPDGRLRLTFDRGTVMGAEEVVADHAVVALPFSLLREVTIDLDLPPPKRRAIAELGQGTHAKILAGFKERTWRTRGSNGRILGDLPFQVAWDASRLQEGREGILANLTGGRRGIEVGQGTTAARAQEFVDGVDRVFPGTGDAHDRRSVRMHWPTHPWSRGSVSAYRVGQATAFGGREIERVGNLHFCGEHTSATHRGTMEGGALTGAMAALEVAEDLGIAVPAGNSILDRARAERTLASRRS